MLFWSSPATPQLSPSALSLCASLVFLCPSVSVAQTPGCVTFPSRKVCPGRDLCHTAHSASAPADPRGVTAVCPRAYFCLQYLKYLLYERSLLSNTYTCQTCGKRRLLQDSLESVQFSYAFWKFWATVPHLGECRNFSGNLGTRSIQSSLHQQSGPAKLPPEGGVGGNTSSIPGWQRWLALLLPIKASAVPHQGGARAVRTACLLTPSASARPDAHMAGRLPAEIGLHPPEGNDA